MRRFVLEFRAIAGSHRISWTLGKSNPVHLCLSPLPSSLCSFQHKSVFLFVISGLLCPFPITHSNPSFLLLSPYFTNSSSPGTSNTVLVSVLSTSLLNQHQLPLTLLGVKLFLYILHIPDAFLLLIAYQIFLRAKKTQSPII